MALIFCPFYSSFNSHSMLSRHIFSVAIMLRLGVYVFLHFSMGIATSGRGLLGKGGSDTPAYFDSVENLLRYGHYTYDLNYLPAYAGRMPGYGAVYGALRLLMPPAWVYNGVVLLQTILACVAIYYLGELAYALTQRRRIAHTVVFVSAISPYGAQADLALLTESFAASALVIGSYYFWQGTITGRRGHLLAAGGWLTWVVFLRPYMAPLLGIWAIIYLYHRSRQPEKNWRNLWAGCFFFLLPFAVTDSAWSVRNWLVYQQFIPLQVPYAGTRISPVYLESRRFAAALGEDPVEWNTASLMAWLTLPKPPPAAAPKLWQLSRHASQDSLVWLRQCIQNAKAEMVPASVQQHNAQQAVAALRRFRDEVAREKPWLYYFVAPLRLTYHLVLTGGGNSIFAWPFGELTLWQKAVRLFFTCTHWLLMGGALLSYLTWPRRLGTGWLLIRLPSLFILTFFVLGLRYVESRYFVVVYPLALLSGIIWFIQIWELTQTNLLASAPNTN